MTSGASAISCRKMMPSIGGATMAIHATDRPFFGCLGFSALSKVLVLVKGKFARKGKPHPLVEMKMMKLELIDFRKFLDLFQRQRAGDRGLVLRARHVTGLA